MVSKLELVISDHELAISELQNGLVRNKREILHARHRIDELERNNLEGLKSIEERKVMLEQALNTLRSEQAAK